MHKPKPDLKSSFPGVSVVLSVHNEELCLETCARSLLALDYPYDKIEFIIGSDGSTDNTNVILDRLSKLDSRIRPLIFENQRGKIQVLNDLIPQTRNPVLFFVDADMTFNREALIEHTKHYSSNSVGGVTGLYNLTSDKRSATFQSESNYHSFEMRLRQNESDIHSSVDLTGANYSIRRELWDTFPSDFILEDMFSALTILSKHKKMVFEPNAIATEVFVRSTKEEFWRKSRFSARGFGTLRYFKKLLLPSAGFTAAMIWSHRIFRWSTPLFLILFFLATVVCNFSVGGTFFLTLFLIECSVVFLAVLGWISDTTLDISIPLVRNIYWFSAMNVALLVGIFRFIFKKETPHWTISSRSVSSESLAPIIPSKKSVLL
jgi:cellulose synthase/poly-beta-1,6-N-acetylglucosamine synthase-like glycosyltransferase